MKTSKGTVRNGKVVLKNASAFADGTEVVVSPLVPGSPQAVLAAMAAPPHLDPKDVDEFERLLAARKRPLSRSNPLTGKRSKKKR